MFRGHNPSYINWGYTDTYMCQMPEKENNAQVKVYSYGDLAQLYSLILEYDMSFSSYCGYFVPHSKSLSCNGH